jgi:hypothetical protein
MHLRLALFALLAVVSATAAQGQTTYVWNDTAPSWSTAADWTPSGPDWTNSLNSANNLASFPGKATINNQPNVDNNVYVGGITIDDSQAAWNISSSFGYLNIGASGLTVIGPAANSKTGAGTVTTTISAKTNILLSQTWTIGQGATVAVTNPLSASSNFIKAGPGTLLLSGGVTNSGSITATNGVLVLSGNNSAATGTITANGGSVQLADGTVLGGNLSLGSNDTSFQATQGGTAAAQTNSPNMFGDSEEATIMGNLTMDDGGIVEFDIDGPDPETGYDQAIVDQNITIADADLDLVMGDYTPTYGEPFFIIDNKGSSPISGQFTNAPEGSIITSYGKSFMVTYDADADTDSPTGGNDVALISVPEPINISVLMGAVLLIGRRSSRKSHH